VAGRSPDSIARWLDGHLYKFDGPGQYLGTEPNAARRPWKQAEVRWLLAASWDYSQAAGNMAIPALYDAVHKAGDYTLADRWYLPATPRDMELLEKAQVPVFGIESRHQLRDFDVVGTSISYTVLFMNFCAYLRMSGVPLRWKDRMGDPGAYPMIMAGGQAWCAPEFMAPAIDCVWLGEAESEPGNPGITEVCEAIAQMKADGLWREERAMCYRMLAQEFPFLYFPRFVEVSYRYEDRGLPELTKMVSGYQLVPGARQLGSLPLRARRVNDLSQVDLMTSAPVLFSDPGMGSGDIEVGRGCPAWCVFCRLSWVTKPYRQELVERTVPRALAWRDAMGSVDISLVAPDPPMHTQKKALIAALLEHVTDKVDASSMRIDDYNNDGDFALLLRVSGTTAITLGLEGNSQRMRDLAGKGTSDDDVAEAVTRAIRAGIRKIKLYFITNWPGEELGDVMRIVELGKRLADIRDSFGPAAKGVQIIFSWTPLLIEAQTPLQWFQVTPPDYMLAGAFKELMDNHRVWVKIGSKAAPEKLAFFQTCQRASRDVGEAVVDVIEAYGTASWGGFPKDMPDRLDDALRARGFRNGLDDINGERYGDDLFGWEHIDTGVKKSLMWRVYRDMVELLEGTDAETYDEACGEDYHGNEWVPRCDQQCSGNACGVCGKDDLELRRQYVQAASRERDLAAEPVRPLDHSTVAVKIRMRVERPEESRFITNESLAFIVRRAAFLAQKDMSGRSRTFPDIASQSVRLASGGTGYRERSAGTDYVEFGLTKPADREDVGEYLVKMAVHMHRWLRWGGLFQVLPAAAKLPPRPPSLWELEVADPVDAVARRLHWWDEAESVPVLIRAESFYAGATSEPGDAKDHVADFWVTRDGQRTLLHMVLTGRLGPYQAYAALTGKASWIEAARYTAARREFFAGGTGQCEGCGLPVPSSLLGTPWSEQFCPRCADEAEGKVTAALAGSGVLQVPAAVRPGSAHAGENLWTLRRLTALRTSTGRCSAPARKTRTGPGRGLSGSLRQLSWSLCRPVIPPPELAVEGTTGCIYCGGRAEPEQDGDLFFFACPECGNEFGHRRVQQEQVCAAGLPVTVQEPGPQAPVFLGSTISRRPE
jgi:radical SAM superfamily enzyme YgiQ (UPF0313 family)